MQLHDIKTYLLKIQSILMILYVRSSQIPATLNYLTFVSYQRIRKLATLQT